MKQFLSLLFVCGAAFAQTKSTASVTKSTAAKSTTQAKAPTAATPPASYKAKFVTTQGDFVVQVCRTDPRQKAPRRASPEPRSRMGKFVTTQGDFVVQVTRAWAPLGADRFYTLVRSGFFTGAPFFRVIPGFMAQ